MRATGKANEAISAVAPAACTEPSATRAPTSSVTKNGLPPASPTWRANRGPGGVPEEAPDQLDHLVGGKGSQAQGGRPPFGQGLQEAGQLG